MKGSITVIGVEAEGIRGLRLEQKGTQWDVADSEFWPCGVEAAGQDPEAGDDEGRADRAEGGGQGESASSAAEDESVSSEDRYAATVEALKAAAKRFGTNEVVLSMPLKSLLVKVSRIPVEERDHLAETAGEELGKVSPFPDENPIVGMETVSETDSELVTVFAALPSAEAADIGDAMDEAKVRVVRTDATALGWLRTLWPKILVDGTRKVVLMNFDDGWDIVVIDNGAPSLLRGLGGISDPAELGREVMLSLLRAGNAADVGEIAVFSRCAVDPAIVEQLSSLATVRSVVLGQADAGEDEDIGPFGGVEGVARRTQEMTSLDVTPSDWVELRTEARFKKKLIVFLSAAAAGWMLIMGVLFGVPFVYGQMTDHQKALSKRHAKAYGEVKEMRDKVKLVQQYSDHARGSLEMLKAVSDRMPAGITLTSFSYRRGERLSIAGEASQPTDVYDFKNALTEAATGDGEKLFSDVLLTGPSQSRGGVHKFSIEGSFVEREEGK